MNLKNICRRSAAASISDNGGRSCINASAIVVPKYAAEIADALAQKLGPIQPTKPDDQNANLSGFANTKMADFIDAQIEDGLKTPGATDVTAKYRNGPRKVTFDGGVYMRPCCATPSRIRSRTRNSSAPTPAWCKCRRARC